MPDAPTDDELDTCWHEAGHVVMYRLLGVRVLFSELLGPRYGLTESEPASASGSSRDKLLFRSGEVLVTLAGTAANTVMRRDRVWDQGDENDLNRARALASAASGHSMYGETEYFSGLQELAANLMTQHRDVINNVALALWHAKRLYEDDIAALIPPELSATADLKSWLENWPNKG